MEIVSASQFERVAILYAVGTADTYHRYQQPTTSPCPPRIFGAHLTNTELE